MVTINQAERQRLEKICESLECNFEEIFKKWQKVCKKYGKNPSAALSIIQTIVEEVFYDEDIPNWYTSLPVYEGKNKGKREFLKYIKEGPEILEDEKVEKILKRIPNRFWQLWMNPCELFPFLEKIKNEEMEVEDLIAYPPFPPPDCSLSSLTHYGRWIVSEIKAYRTYVNLNENETEDEKIKEIMKYPGLRKKLKSFLEKLEKWKKEGEELEKIFREKFVLTGFWVKYDDSINIDEASKYMVNSDATKLKLLINHGFKAPSWFIWDKILVGDLYDISKRADENPGTAYVLNHWDELSTIEKEYIAKNDEAIRELIGLKQIEDVIERTPKGVYFWPAPMHGGHAGRDAEETDPRSYAMVDRVFHKHNDKYVNVVEYFINTDVDFPDVITNKKNTKIRIYEFKEEPSRKAPGKGVAVEIEINGKKKFLTENEVKDFERNLEKYTLPTLFLKGYFERFT